MDSKENMDKPFSYLSNYLEKLDAVCLRLGVSLNQPMDKKLTCLGKIFFEDQQEFKDNHKGGQPKHSKQQIEEKEFDQIYLYELVNECRSEFGLKNGKAALVFLRKRDWVKYGYSSEDAAYFLKLFKVDMDIGSLQNDLSAGKKLLKKQDVLSLGKQNVYDEDMTKRIRRKGKNPENSSH